MNDIMIPKFLQGSLLNTWLSATNINKHFRVDGILPTSFVNRCERNGKPIRTEIYNGQKRYRISDIVLVAINEGLEITQPLSDKLIADIKTLEAERSSLLAQVSSLKHEAELSKISTKLTGKTLLREQEIVQAAQELPNKTGIYFLILRSRVIYVGQSINIFSRVLQHTDKEFDSFAFILCDASLLDKMESLYIHYLRPIANGTLNSNDLRPCAPLSLDYLLNA